MHFLNLHEIQFLRFEKSKQKTFFQITKFIAQIDP